MSDQHECKGTIYALATIGSCTECGSHVTHATSGWVIAGLRAARVGDIVICRDGSEAAIIDGAGLLSSYDGKSNALVDSYLSTGNWIVFTPWDDGHPGTYSPVTEEQVARDPS
ncbi:PAAR domain-containing protein [Paraburkholderia sp. J12]|uniref:PAAR domain-containing protein n=1 Tax=Paraburkholderia sp. J12 TaxID=2805432 RepID=UPI002ABD52B3|nr:PAAR domain-containing protein [Paraburkholderia sp. J12]